MQIKRRNIPEELPSIPNLSPVLQRIFKSRGINDAAELDKRLKALTSFHSLIDIDKSVLRLEQALHLQERILIVGDFDADGATSSVLAITALKAMGALHVEYLVPNRFEFGYGLTPELVEVSKRWQPNLIVTVDNGISNIEGVDAANALGIDVIITDHHLPGEILPKAHSIVNPNQLGDQFPSKSIAGVGVIFYVMLALRRRLVETNWFITQNIHDPNMAQFLDLVALGTVADVVALDKNNRILVNQGLIRIRQGLLRPGIRALIEIAGRKCEQIRESDLGFIVAPRLNAAGRLDDMSLGIECLLAHDLETARKLAKKLDTLNQERRKIELEMKDQALDYLNKLVLKETELPLALCLYEETWHQGVIGVLAGRLKEKYHRPVLAFAAVSENELKGSARSILGLNIRDILAAIAKDYPHLITKFGGHAMAAGLSIELKNFQDFRQAFVNEVSKYISVSQCSEEILTDGPLQSHELTLDLASQLNAAGPWGQQFPEPVFDNIFEILEQRIVGQQHLKLTLKHKDGHEIINAIAFYVDLKQWPNHRARYVHAAYRLDINEFNGRVNLQLVINAISACPDLM